VLAPIRSHQELLPALPPPSPTQEDHVSRLLPASGLWARGCGWARGRGLVPTTGDSGRQNRVEVNTDSGVRLQDDGTTALFIHGEVCMVKPGGSVRIMVPQSEF